MDKEALESLMVSKSDEDLAKYISEIGRYTPEAIETAVTEFQRRGRHFSQSELENIQSIIEQKKAARERDFDFKNDYIEEEFIVADPNATEYYPKKLITGFSLSFSALAGAILLASNLRNNRKAQIVTVVFGVLYTFACLAFLAQVEEAKPRRYLAFFFNLVGGAILTGILWNKYIGEQTKYRAKFTWQAVLISVLASIPLLVVLFFRF